MLRVVNNFAHVFSQSDNVHTFSRLLTIALCTLVIPQQDRCRELGIPLMTRAEGLWYKEDAYDFDKDYAS